MTSKEFAEKYAGKRVRIISKLTDNDVPRVIDNPNPIAIIVGYRRDQIVVNFEDPKDSVAQWAAGSYYELVFVINNITSGWHVQQKSIELLDEKVIAPYPHTCKVCKSPARKNANVLLCSNIKCKSSNKKKYIVKQIRVVNEFDEHLICRYGLEHPCNRLALYAKYIKPVASKYKYTLDCAKGHSWDVFFNHDTINKIVDGKSYRWDHKTGDFLAVYNTK